MAVVLKVDAAFYWTNLLPLKTCFLGEVGYIYFLFLVYFFMMYSTYDACFQNLIGTGDVRHKIKNAHA